MKLSTLAPRGAAFAAVLALAPFAANAQDAGATIYGNDDAPIGTVESNDGATVLVDTGSYKAPLPASAVAEREGKWTVNATKDQINGMMAAQAAEAEKKLAAALVEGAAVVSADNMPAGTIIAIDENVDQIIVENEAGIMSLKREHFAVNPSNQLTALFTQEQLAGFVTEVPEGVEIRTASGRLIRNADGSQPTGEETATASAAPGGAAAGASE